ncbi:MAG TPA: hypothetical protein VJY62_15625, partial [Bacteroidia bacterium]|nr:hypothetical protein [Bacteroidia bacterium]
FIGHVNPNIGKKIVLNLDADSIDVLIKKRDSILLSQPSSQFLIILGCPAIKITPEINSFIPTSQSIKSGDNTQAISITTKNADSVTWKLFSVKGGTIRGIKPDNGFGKIIPAFNNLTIVTGKNVELTFTITPYLKNKSGKSEEYNISIIAPPPPDFKVGDEFISIVKDSAYTCYGSPYSQCKWSNGICGICNRAYIYCQQKFRKKGNPDNASITLYGGDLRCKDGNFHSQLTRVVEISPCGHVIGTGE